MGAKDKRNAYLADAYITRQTRKKRNEALLFFGSVVLATNPLDVLSHGTPSSSDGAILNVMR